MAVAPLVSQSQLVDRIQENWEGNGKELSKSDIKEVLTILEWVTEDAIENCERVKIAGVYIEPKLVPKRKARMGRNPATNEEIKIPAKPASVTVKAKPTKALKDVVPSIQKARRVIGK
jgi:nucleoid DNA-binding protein